MKMPGEENEEADQRKLRKRLESALRERQIEQQKKDMAKQFMDEGAYDRLMNIRLTNHELFSQVINVIISLAQNGRLQGKMNEAQLKSIIERLTFKPESKIEFKHK
jgi:programmed cell death protein 5